LTGNQELRALQTVSKRHSQEMDAATARTANLAKHGDSHEKEAQGLQLMSRVFQADGRLEFHKSFEGARADFCVYRPGAQALGVQLKTTGGNWVHGRTGKEYNQFRHTDGYAGLLIVFVALHTQPQRIFLADGSRVVSKSVTIPATFRREVRSDKLREVEVATVAGEIYTIYMEAMAGPSNYMLRSPVDHEKPEDGSRLVEYNAFKRLQRSLPVLFIDPPAEHMSHDYVVDGKKWQLKLAQYNKKDNTYRVTCQKSAGRVDGKLTKRQYEVDDFDFLCIQLPVNTTDCCYIIPQGVLAERGVIGKSANSSGAVRIYPHRPVTAWNSVLTAGAHWTEAYRINFASDSLAQLAHITRGRAAGNV
jgi:hypothetical protein